MLGMGREPDPVKRSLAQSSVAPTRALWLLVIAGILAAAAWQVYSFREAWRDLDLRESQPAPVVDAGQIERERREAAARQREAEAHRHEEFMQSELLRLQDLKAPALKPGCLRVAAVQYAPLFGEPRDNREALAALVRVAVKLAASVVVLPEAAIPGLDDPQTGAHYVTENPDFGVRAVQDVAETLDGPSVTEFAELAKTHGIYLTVPLIERTAEGFASTAVLLDPEGKPALVARRRTAGPTDTAWLTPSGDLPGVASTPFGVVGIVMGTDGGATLPLLRQQGAALALHCAALRGTRVQAEMQIRAPRLAKENGMAYVVANGGRPRGCAEKGLGWSRAITADGTVIAERDDAAGNAIVIADVPLPALSVDHAPKK